MPRLVLIAALAVTALLQPMIVGGVIGGGRPDLVLLVVICWALQQGSEEGAFAGALGGLFLDLFSAGPFGLNAVLLGVIGLISGLGEGSLSRGHWPLVLSTGVLATVAFHGATYLALQASGWVLPSAAVFVGVVLPSAAINGVLMVPCFRVSRHLIRITRDWRQLEV